MSRAETSLSRHIFAENFSGIVAQVADFLMSNGPKTMAMIGRGCRTSVVKVQRALRILIQHHFVTMLPSDTPIYRINNDAVLNLLRYPKYLQLVGQKLGVDAQVLVEQIIKCGELPVSKLLFICGAEILESNPSLSDDQLNQQISSLYVTVKMLAEFQFIIQSINLGKEEEPLSEAEKEAKNSTVDLSLFVVPNVTMNELIAQVKEQEKGNVSKFPDSDVYFKVNLKKFQEALRNQLVLKALERKYKPMVDPKLFEIIVDLGFAKHPWEKESIPVSVNEVADIIRKAIGDSPIIKYIDEHFDILEQDPLRIFTKLGTNYGGQFVFSMKEVFTHIMWSTIERTVTDRHGYHAARIFRLIKENKFVEQERIQELGMIPAKEAKHLTYKLVNDRFVVVKEVRKSYSVGGIPGKIAFLFHVDLNQVVLALMESCYKSMVNCKTRQRKEWLKNSQLLRKEDRINRILAKMQSQQCTEEQMSEIQELITPPERAVLMRHEAKTTTLMSGVMHLDETIFIIQMYLFYNQKKPPPKSGRNRQKQNVIE
ncbi:DNA-directed RNA polymerase III subunit RPC3 [Orchesella cincta]|uniref:DNA-directed RNA polymerase III subunit RPC3 n=1 Tax=Orchesella cincta TaxID=48709 RepID=A0A1D2NLR3_ORCCI|nr:DNA-directed RNA polymerase III subunit RPC3 [Orchesella cincta]